jgi:uncharacterized protein (TIGR02186 family)
MRIPLSLAAILPALAMAHAAERPPSEEVVSDISTREIAIKSNFAGIEILIFGSIDFSARSVPERGTYDVVVVIRAPGQALVARRKQRVAGIWVNGPGETYPMCLDFMRCFRPGLCEPLPPRRRWSRSASVSAISILARG